MTRCCRILALLAAGHWLTAQPRQDRHVVVISIDGFAAYALKNPAIPLPNLRRLMREGAAAESMSPVNPTVTWPNHTTLVTGVSPARHTVLYNGWAVRGGEGEPVKVEPHVDKDKLVKGQTVYDLAYKAGLTTAEVDWVAIEHAPSITWSFAEWPQADGKVEQELISAGAVSPAEIRDFTKAPITFRDEVWTIAAEHILTKHRPNLLLFHLLTTDSVQHRYGARSLAAETALALADTRVGRIVEACRRAGILPQTTFVVVSDHGFKTHQREVRPNALLRAKGLSGSAWVIPEGGTAMVYVTSKADRAKTLEVLRQAFIGVEGIARVLPSTEFAQHGYPSPDDNPRMADLVLIPAEGFAFSGVAQGSTVTDVPSGATPGGHGYLNTDPDMQAIFIVSGAGVKRGAKLGVINNVDVAPTLARLLGLQMEDAEGRALIDALE